MNHVIINTMADFERVSCMRGYHVHRYIWDAVVGESLTCRREPLNPRDRYVCSSSCRKISCL